MGKPVPPDRRNRLDPRRALAGRDIAALLMDLRGRNLGGAVRGLTTHGSAPLSDLAPGARAVTGNDVPAFRTGSRAPRHHVGPAAVLRQLPARAVTGVGLGVAHTALRPRAGVAPCAPVLAGIPVVGRDRGDNPQYRRALARLRDARYDPRRIPRRRRHTAPPAARRRWPAHRPGDRWGMPRHRHR